MEERPFDPVVEVEVRDLSAAETKPRSSLTDREAVYAVGEHPQRRSWLQRHRFKLSFLLGWILFPCWWAASFLGYKKRHTLKGWERAAWYACIFLSLAGLIIFLIFIIWYGADPEGEKRRLVRGYATRHPQAGTSPPPPPPPAVQGTVVSSYSLQLRGACSNATFASLVSSVSTAVTSAAQAAGINPNSILVTRGGPCTESSSTGRHLLQTVSSYHVLVKAVQGTSTVVQSQLANTLSTLDVGADPLTPSWCGSFCSDNKQNIAAPPSSSLGPGFQRCSSYTCSSGTLLANKIVSGKANDAGCCTTCTASLCPAPAKLRTKFTLAANATPTFDVCCDACGNITCPLGAVNPPPPLDNETTPTEAICCIPETVAAPAVTMSLPAPNGCNATTAANLARETQTQITRGGVDDAGVIDVTATCETAAVSPGGGPGRRLTDAGDIVRLTISVKDAKTPAEMKQATKVLMQAVGLDPTTVPDNATVESMVQQLTVLKNSSSGALAGLVTKIQAAAAAANLTVNITQESLASSLAATSVVVLCAGQPFAPKVDFPQSCISAAVGAECAGTCRVGVGIVTLTCGTDGRWTAANGTCQAASNVVQKNCTSAPDAVTNADWPSDNCSGLATCTTNCTDGYSGTMTAMCNPATGAWTSPVGSCTPLRCPPIPDDAATIWPGGCLLKGKDSECDANCKLDALEAERGPPTARCRSDSPNSNSLVWDMGGGQCWAPTTCGNFNASMCSAATNNATILNPSTPCFDPDPEAPFNKHPDKHPCTEEICCRVPMGGSRRRLAGYPGSIPRTVGAAPASTPAKTDEATKDLVNGLAAVKESPTFTGSLVKTIKEVGRAAIISEVDATTESVQSSIKVP